MSIKHLAGFAAVCGLVFLGVDYEQQTRRAGLDFGSLSLSGYAGTIESRYLGHKAEQRLADLEQERRDRWRQGGKAYLPEAPAGMERFSLLERPEVLAAGGGGAEAESDPLAELDQALDSVRLQKRAAKMDPHSWGYAKDGEVVVLSVHLRGLQNPNTLGGMVVSSMRGMGLPEEPYAVIGGVAFGRDQGIYKRSSGKMRKFEGVLGFGERATIVVHADAPDSTIREVLAAIDYDGLNGLLEQPVPTVGNDVTVPAAAEQELARDITRLRSELQSIEAKAAQLKIENIDPGKLLAGAVTGTTAFIDVTSGDVPDPGAVLEAAYRERLTRLMAEAGAVRDGVAIEAEDPAAMEAGGNSSGATSGKLAGLAGSLLGVFTGGSSQEGSPAPQDSSGVSPVKVSKGLAGDGGEGSGCIRSGTTRTCD
ncbi:hypothetical protein [Leisingera sp. ANG-S5]|uniref:hypothetical protein n=1 Tax=Leisingera sp. ANG-S5 TaxID=1577901 RepID=UPI00057DC5BA|nr:hypothetical protein [Leisingera sp. ANG-S5]KIC28020.1 hypothetical protein RA25_21845 [Leisingera sp. ANG-S5]